MARDKKVNLGMRNVNLVVGCGAIDVMDKIRPSSEKDSDKAGPKTCVGIIADGICVSEL